MTSGLLALPSFPELPAVPDFGGEGEHALANSRPHAFGDGPPRRSRDRWHLTVSMIDSIHSRTRPGLPIAWPLIAEVGAHECGVEEATSGLNSSKHLDGRAGLCRQALASQLKTRKWGGARLCRAPADNEADQ